MSGMYYTIYYVEINLTCIIVLLLIQHQLRHKYELLSTGRIVFYELLWATILLCFSDMVAGVCRGRFFWGAREIIEFSNLVYFESLSVISYLWMLYVQLKLGILEGFSRRKTILLAAPLAIFTLMALTNPFTHILFSVDENNLYARNVGVYFHWVVTWLYLIIPTAQTAREMIREKSKHRRRDMAYLLYFIIAPSIASIVQMLFYGVSSTQVGITVSIVAIFLVVQGRQVLTDALTGLNNRRGLANYFDNFLQHGAEDELSVLMLDLNNFKHVNDKFGHMVGDRALQDAADALKQACNKAPRRLFLCRYGGDEFLITGSIQDPAELNELKTIIDSEINAKNRTAGKPYALEFGVGSAHGKCTDMDDIEFLIRAADRAMYMDKERLKRA